MLNSQFRLFMLLLILLFASMCLIDTVFAENISQTWYPSDGPTVIPTEPTLYPSETPIFTSIPTELPTITIEPTTIGGDYGWVSIESVPSGADVYFDGSNRGTTPVQLKVMSTAVPYHQIWMQKSGYQEWSTSISENPAPGQTIPVKAMLIPIQPTETWTIPPTPTQKPTEIPTPPTPYPTPTMIGSDYGWFSVDSVPTGAEITFDSIYQGPAPAFIKVYTTGSPDHQILVRMIGYYDWTRSITQNPGPEATIPVLANLIPISRYGNIMVTSSPTRSIATLDGGIQYMTPCTFYDLNPGLHTIRVSHEGYQPYSQQVRVTTGGQSQMSATLLPVEKSGTVYVTSTPAGADIYIDHGYYGQTPYVVSASSGSHNIELKLGGYQNYQSAINILAGQQVPLYVSLSPDRPSFGSIQVASTPGGSAVRLNGDYYGQTPDSAYLDIPSLSPGTYNILISHPQNQDYSGTVAVNAGLTTTVNVALQAAQHPASVNGTLFVNSNPSGANVLINNEFKGISPVTISSIQPGKYIITLRMEEYQDATREINVSAGMESYVMIDLIPNVQPTSTPVTPVPIETKSPAPVLPIIIGLVVSFIWMVSWTKRR